MKKSLCLFLTLCALLPLTVFYVSAEEKAEASYYPIQTAKGYLLFDTTDNRFAVTEYSEKTELEPIVLEESPELNLNNHVFIEQGKISFEGSKLSPKYGFYIGKVSLREGEIFSFFYRVDGDEHYYPITDYMGFSLFRFSSSGGVAAYLDSLRKCTITSEYEVGLVRYTSFSEIRSFTLYCFVSTEEAPYEEAVKRCPSVKERYFSLDTGDKRHIFDTYGYNQISFWEEGRKSSGIVTYERFKKTHSEVRDDVIFYEDSYAFINPDYVIEGVASVSVGNVSLCTTKRNDAPDPVYAFFYTQMEDPTQTFHLVTKDSPVGVRILYDDDQGDSLWHIVDGVVSGLPYEDEQWSRCGLSITLSGRELGSVKVYCFLATVSMDLTAEHLLRFYEEPAENLCKPYFNKVGHVENLVEVGWYGCDEYGVARTLPGCGGYSFQIGTVHLEYGKQYLFMKVTVDADYNYVILTGSSAVRCDMDLSQGVGIKNKTTGFPLSLYQTSGDEGPYLHMGETGDYDVCCYAASGEDNFTKDTIFRFFVVEAP